MARSGSGISAIFASSALSPSALRASAFSSWARSLIAARSSAVNPLDLVPLAPVPVAGFCVTFFELIVPPVQALCPSSRPCSGALGRTYAAALLQRPPRAVPDGDAVLAIAPRSATSIEPGCSQTERDSMLRMSHARMA